MTFIWSSRWHCQPIMSCFINLQIGLAFLVPAYPGCPGKSPLNECLSVVFHLCCADFWCCLSTTVAYHSEWLPTEKQRFKKDGNVNWSVLEFGSININFNCVLWFFCSRWPTALYWASCLSACILFSMPSVQCFDMVVGMKGIQPAKNLRHKYQRFAFKKRSLIWSKSIKLGQLNRIWKW